MDKGRRPNGRGSPPATRPRGRSHPDRRYAGVDTGSAPDPALRLGAKGEAVTELQAALVRLGLLQKGADDGFFGAATEAAVRAFQSAHPQLIVDGIAGPATRAQIARALDARGKLAGTGAGAAVAAATAAAGQTLPAAPHSLVLPTLIAATLLLAALGLTLWRYRDEIRLLLFMERKS